MKKLILITVTTLFLSGCLLISAVGTALVVSNDRRTAGEILDDKGISFNLFAWNKSKDKKLKNAHFNFLVYDKKVLVTGEAPTDSVRHYIMQQVKNKDFKIRKVINEIRIAPNSSFASRAQDALITTKIELSFLDQEVFNPAHIKVTTENNTVYLMGRATSREANKATKIAASTGGVERIIKLFHYLKTRPAIEIRRDKERKAQAKKRKNLSYHL